MNRYKRRYLASFKKDLKTFRKNMELITRVQDKIEEILEDPYHYKPLRNVLKNMP